MEDALKREEWDFSCLEAEALIPALLWEVRRECVEVDEVAMKAQAWLDGKLSTKKPAPMARDKRTGRRLHFSEADRAKTTAMAVFDDFLPINEACYLHKWSARRCRLELDSWLAAYLRPVIKHYNLPWLCLPAEERQRLCDIFNRKSNANVVHVGSWWDAVSLFERSNLDGGLPLKFDYSDYTSVLLTINWRFSNKRILAAMGKILNQIKPPDMTQLKRWDGRGKKDRDLLVKLERFAIMRLLHHYTLSELKRRLPEAWNLYSNRKWYDERRHALLDFRGVIGCRDTDFFPKHWLTKARRTCKTPQMPAKQGPI
jgi:hypothetical protein